MKQSPGAGGYHKIIAVQPTGSFQMTLHARLFSHTFLQNSKPIIEDFIQRLLVPIPPVGPETRCEEVYALFATDRSIQSIAVVDDELPVGLVNRFALVDRFSRRFFRELYERKPISLVMEKSPLIVESTVGLDDLSSIIADEEEKYLYEGFIITLKGKYLGIGTGQRLMKEMTERKQAQLYHLAHHDPLTGLPNRMLFYDRLDQALTQAERTGKCLGVLFIDLDHFKHINDSLGHPMGDLLLQEVSQGIQNCLRSGDTLARQGGDEFTVILTNVANPEDVEKVGQKILSVLCQPIRLGDQEARITCSIGASLYPKDGDNIDSLIQKADTAVYNAKKSRNCFRYYEEGLPLAKN
ncbi:MAG TPA: GGDEF domain-containing protein [bacterium]|jgi:diguanylate cyclase (GGDEF)-like protein|nr:GGDEF domain-containing protein [bacterium]